VRSGGCGGQNLRLTIRSPYQWQLLLFSQYGPSPLLAATSYPIIFFQQNNELSQKSLIMSALIVYSMIFGSTLVPRFLSRHCAPTPVFANAEDFRAVCVGFQRNVQKPSLQKSRNWRQWLLAAYHGPEAAYTGLVCNVRNFSSFVAPCQPVLGRFPFENLPRDLCGDGRSVTSARVLLPTLLMSLTVSISLHWNFFTRIHVVKCFRNCSKIFSCETML